MPLWPCSCTCVRRVDVREGAIYEIYRSIVAVGSPYPTHARFLSENCTVQFEGWKAYRMVTHGPAQ